MKIASARSSSKLDYFKIEKSNTALIVIDLANEFVREGGKLHVPSAKATLPTNRKLIDFFRINNMPVIYTKTYDRSWNLRVQFANIRDPERIPNKVHVPGHKRYFSDVKKELDVTDIVEEIYPVEGDYIVEKELLNAFNNTNLDLLLRSLDVKSVVITGTLTHICVESTFKAAFEMQYRAVMVSDAVSTWLPDEFVEKLFEIYRQMWGKVMTSSEVMKELSQSSIPAPRRRP
jgi:nicotinamidase-related amidase